MSCVVAAFISSAGIALRLAVSLATGLGPSGKFRHRRLAISQEIQHAGFCRTQQVFMVRTEMKLYSSILSYHTVTAGCWLSHPSLTPRTGGVAG